MLKGKKAEDTVSAFKRSTESTVRAITNKSNINIQFDSENIKRDDMISLPKINNILTANEISYIRGSSDSASLVNKYHNFSKHIEMRPKNEQKAAIFDELEFLRCESLGTRKLPGVKKNIGFLDNQTVKKLGKNNNLSKALTFKFIIKKNIFNEKLSKKLLQISDPIIDPLIKVLNSKKFLLEESLDNQNIYSKIILDLIDLVFKKENFNSEDTANEQNSEDHKNEDVNQEENEENNNDKEEQKSSIDMSKLIDGEQELNLEEKKVDDDTNDENNSQEVSSRYNPCASANE